MKLSWSSLFRIACCLCLLLSIPVSAAEIRQVSLSTNWLDYNPGDGMLYVSFGSGTGERGNTVAPLDPLTLGLGSSVFVGSEPGRMAISDNGEYLYTYLAGSASIRRMHLPTQQAGLQFALGSDGAGAWLADDLEVVPGQPNLLMATMAHRGLSPRSVGTAVYDNGVRRPDMNRGGNAHTIDSTGNRAFVFHNETSGSGLWWVGIGANGVTHWGHDSRVLNGYGIDGKFHEGLIYANNSQVYDPETDTLVGSYSGGQGIPIVDSAANRVYYLNGWGSDVRIVVYDRERFVPLETINIPGVTGGTSCFVSCGGNSVAFRTATQIFVVRISDIPTAPARLTATAATGPLQVNLTWSDNSSEETAYRVYRKVGDGSYTDYADLAAGATSFRDMRVVPGATYSYKVAAYSDTVGLSRPSLPAAATTAAAPAAPTELAATPVRGSLKIDVTWQDNSTDESAYYLYRRVGDGAWSYRARVGANVRSFRDTGTAGATYTYRVRVYKNGVSYSFFSNEDEATLPRIPGAPSGLTATAGAAPRRVDLAWSDNSDDELFFIIYRKVGDEAYAYYTRVGADATAFRDTGVAAGTKYTYQVRGWNGSFYSGFSNPAEATPEPPVE